MERQEDGDTVSFRGVRLSCQNQLYSGNICEYRRFHRLTIASMSKIRADGGERHSWSKVL